MMGAILVCGFVSVLGGYKDGEEAERGCLHLVMRDLAAVLGPKTETFRGE